jgi:DNA-binding NtrC family response regulator
MPRFKLPVLAVDDDETSLAMYRTWLQRTELGDYVACHDSREAMAALERGCSAVVLDLNMPHLGGEELLGEIRARHPALPVIVVTAESDLSRAVACMRAGAWDYLVKPVEASRLLSSLRHAVQMNELRSEVGSLGRRLLDESAAVPGALSEIVTANPAFRQTLAYLKAVAPSAIPVLVTGESGTGKELAARAVHRLSGRKGPFVAVNVAGLDDTVFVDTLFGHRRGAYTGAEGERKGLVEQAREGTLFLDEIGDLSAPSQVKLLRLLQEGEYYPLGADVARICDARVVAATNVDVRLGNLRRDLFYRLATYQVHLAPLRERPEDVPLLLDRFIREAAESLKRPAPTVEPGAVLLLQGYSFPGNVRELRSLVLDALTRYAGSELRAGDIAALLREKGAPATPAPAAAAAPVGAAGDPLLSLPGRFPTLAEAETFLVDEAMRRSGGNQSAAARLLGVAQSTLSRRLHGTIARDA